MRKWKIQKKWNSLSRRYRGSKMCILLLGALVIGILSGCGNAKATEEDGRFWEAESAEDGKIDFSMLKEQNPDIFAWLYVPGTNIDLPILQSGKKDDYYKYHTIDGTESDAGAPYTEMANLMNMCDFNTIIHAKDLEEGDWFYELHQFENPAFFEENMVFYIYLPDNVLTYVITAAYYDEGSDLLRRYDYTTYDGCLRYLEQMKEQRDMGKQMREGVEMTPYHYLVTLNGSIRPDKSSQYVVIGMLVNDAAGTIDRVILD